MSVNVLFIVQANKRKRRREMKEYRFRVTLCGYGNTPEEAWEDAYDSFAADPGEYETCEINEEGDDI